VAKIGDLEVGKLKIDEDSITGMVIGATSIVVAQAYGHPNQIYATGKATYSSVAKTNGSATFSVARSTNGGSPTITYSVTFSFSGNTGGPPGAVKTFDMAGVDISHSSSETYTLSASASVSDPLSATCTISGLQIVCVYEKV
jgi:hypothetical protein